MTQTSKAELPDNSSPVASGGLLPELDSGATTQHGAAAPASPSMISPPQSAPTSPTNTFPSAQSQTHEDDHAAPDYDSLYPQSTGQSSDAKALPHEQQLLTPPPSNTPEQVASSSSALSPTQSQATQKKSWGGRLSSLTRPGFLPGPMERECEKAAQILKAFCKNGVYADSAPGLSPITKDTSATKADADGPANPSRQKSKDRVIVTIPSRVIQRAVGLAIFTTLRAGFHFSGAAGSGIIVSRLPDGSWSPPSGIQILTVGTGFQFGVDIYDCVCVINTREALSAFMDRTRVSLGSDIAISAGPYGAGGALEVGAGMEFRGSDKKSKGKGKSKETGTPTTAVGQTPDGILAEKAQTTSSSTNLEQLEPSSSKSKAGRSTAASALRPVFSYVKSRGFYAGVQVDGTVIIERKDANRDFYGHPIPVGEILQGNVPNRDGLGPSARMLMDVLKGAEGREVTRAPTEVSVPGSSHSADADVNMQSVEESHGVAEKVPSPPGYEPSMDGSEVQVHELRASMVAPPAYVDDGAERSLVLDSKHQPVEDGAGR